MQYLACIQTYNVENYDDLYNPFSANISITHIIHLVLVGFSVAIALQNRQCTVRSHESTIDMLL